MREIEDRARKNRLDKLFAEVSITAKLFFEAITVKKQQSVIIRGAELTNFVMEKIIIN
jgi:hypothetical protein